MEYYVYDGEVSSGIILDNDWMYVSSGGTATDTTVNEWGRMYVSSGGTATSTTVNSDGSLDVSSGGTATDTTVNSDGLLAVWYGTAENTTVNSGGWMYAFSGGTAANTTVNSGGHLHVSGGTAANLVLAEGAYCDFTVAPNTYIQGTSAGSAFLMENASISGYTVNSGSMYVYSGGTAISTTVNSGRMYVYSGGTATDISWTPCIGHVWAADGAYVTYASSYSGVYYGSNGQLLSNAMTMDGKLVDGTMYIFTGGTANDTTVDYNGCMYVSSGGTANSTTVEGKMTVSSGGTANNTTIHGEDGFGEMHVSSGGTANGIILKSGGLYVDSGGKLTGSIAYYGVYGSEDALIEIGEGGIIDFDISGRTGSSPALINDF